MNATRGTGGPFDPDALLRDFNLYDRNVDIVSAYQWAFTRIRELAPTVEHFERYPRTQHQDGRDGTPDFTVLFKDGRAILGEIANIARRDESVEGLCKQLARYGEVEGVPGADGEQHRPSTVDVMFLTPMDTGPDAARRLFEERVDNPQHSYKPDRRPVMVQFARTDDRYIFQPWPDRALNGTLTPGPIDVGAFPELKLRPDRFASIKAQYAFMNDPVKPLYLATRLWTSVFPSRFWVDDAKNEFTATADSIAAVVRQHYGRGRVSDVKEAMHILSAAGLAASNLDGEWTVTRRTLRNDVQKAIADRIAKGSAATPLSRRQRREADAAQGALF